MPQNIDDDEDDNILRKIPLKVQTASPASGQIQEGQASENRESSPESPQSPCSPEMLTTPKFKEQDSIELDPIAAEQKIEKIQDYSLINKFFSFLDVSYDNNKNKELLNDTLSGYFCKVCLVIISQKPKELMVYMEETDFKIIDNLIAHVDNKSITELIIKFLDEIIKQLGKDGGPPVLQDA